MGRGLSDPLILKRILQDGPSVSCRLYGLCVSFCREQLTVNVQDMGWDHGNLRESVEVIDGTSLDPSTDRFVISAVTQTGLCGTAMFLYKS